MVRLSFYLRQLEAFEKSDKTTISSKQLGDALGYTDAQVRKDLAYFGQFGHPGIGYRVEELITQLRKILGTDKVWNVLLVGAGNLGRALIAYRGFLRKGFRLAAIFDADERKVGQQFGDLTISSIDKLPAIAMELNIKLGIMSVPGEAAQVVADKLVAAGIRGILNLRRCQLPCRMMCRCRGWTWRSSWSNCRLRCRWAGNCRRCLNIRHIRCSPQGRGKDMEYEILLPAAKNLVFRVSDRCSHPFFLSFATVLRSRRFRISIWRPRAYCPVCHTGLT